MKKKLVIFSGGLDSTAMALIAKTEPNCKVSLMTFDYGQKAQEEIARARRFAEMHGMSFVRQDISSLKFIFGDTQLTSDNNNIQEEYKKDVVVPLRNALFLQIAMIYAYTCGYDEVILGSHLDDCVEVNGERLFPDCSPEFFKAFELAMDFGTFRKDKKVKIVSASTLGMGKTNLIKRGVEINAHSIYNSWSCYKSGEHQCGVCDSCRNRKKAFKDANIVDNTIYEQ